MDEILSFLAHHTIPYRRYDHTPVFTVEESLMLPKMPGAGTKNLLLRDESGSRFILVIVEHEKRVDMKELRTMLGARKLSFATPVDLLRLLGVEPGSVTVLGLLNDPAHLVEVVIDEPLMSAAEIQCHPLKNTATLVIPRAGLLRFLEITGHACRVLAIPEKDS